MNPLIRTSLTHIEQERHDFLEGIDFEIEEDKQQLIFHRVEPGFASTPQPPFAYFLLDMMLVNVRVPRMFKGPQQGFELGFVEPRECA
jgi:hypothetical protein